MINFPDCFFKNETRCGFYITEMMKRFWGVQMDILSWVDSVCEKYGIGYIMCFGSLIGTVRHKGYIPWDDDIDIAMLRDDYNRFSEAVIKELPSFLSTQSLLPGAIPPKELIFSVCNGKSINTSMDFLNLFHGCPYAVNIDLYVFDKIPDDPGDFAYQDRLIRLLDRMLMLQWDHDSNSLNEESAREYEAIYRAMESELSYTFTSSEPMTIQILRLLDLACSLCNDSPSHRVENREQMLYYGDRGFTEEHFKERLFVPYEDLIDVPIPKAYDPLLKKIFGDYCTPRKFTGQHPYPSYRNQREILYKAYLARDLQVPDEFLEYDENGMLIVDPLKL